MSKFAELKYIPQIKYSIFMFVS